MNLQNLVNNYVDYNLWANTAYAAWLKTKPLEVLNVELPSSYPGIYHTFKHLWDTERFWLTLWQTGQPVDEFSPEFNGTAYEALDEWLKQSKAMADYVHSLSEEDLLKPFVLDMPWMQGTMPLYEFIQHCMNHGSYHRGQIVTIGRNLGLTDPPMTDYNLYNLVVKKRV